MHIDPLLRRELDLTGMPWTVENGGRHAKIRLCGRLATIIPRNNKQTAYRRAVLNAVSQVRRLAAQLRSAHP